MRKFDKSITNQMKALALLLMLVHHLWMQHELVRYGSCSYGGILMQLSTFGKICVGIFMFLSGYGLMASAEIVGGYNVVSRLRKVLFPFWFIVVLAAVFLAVVGKLNFMDVITDSLLITHNMNGPWWFMQTYVIFVVCFPLFRKSFSAKVFWLPLLVASLVIFQPLAVWIRPYSEPIHCFLFYFPVFYAGMACMKFGIIDWVDSKNLWMKAFLGMALLLLRFVLGLHIMNVGLIIMMIVVVMDVQAYLVDGVKRVLNFLGAMSMNMWLIHQFFIDYGWHCSNPIFDLVLLYMESLLAAWIIWRSKPKFF